MIKQLLNKIFKRRIRLQLTPKGECLINYINKKLNGEAVFIQEYENIINKIKEKEVFQDTEEKELLQTILLILKG